MAVRELDFIVDTRTDTELSGVNQSLRGLTNRRIPLEPRHIIGFNVTARPDDRTAVVRITINDFPLVADYTNPQNGKAFPIAGAPQIASIIMSNPIDETHSAINIDGATPTSGIRYNGSTFGGTSSVSVINSHKIELNLPNIVADGLWSGTPNSWNAVGIHMVELFNLQDIDGSQLERSIVYAWSVQQETANIDPGDSFPYTKEIRHGTYRVARIVIDRTANIERQLTDYLNSNGISRESVIEQSLVTSHASTLELYILYFNLLYPRVIQMYPNQGSNTPLETPPDNLMFVFSDSVDTGCLRESGNVLIDGEALPPSAVTFAAGGAELKKSDTIMFIDPSVTSSGQDSGFHSITINDICDADGNTSSAPPLFTNYAISSISTGGVDDDPYLHTGFGGTVDGPVTFNTGFTLPGASAGSVLYHDGLNYVALPPGNSGDSLTTDGVGEIPRWDLITGSGGASSNSFVTFVMPVGDNIIATAPNDTITFTLGDDLVILSGNNTTQTVAVSIVETGIDHNAINNVGTRTHVILENEIDFVSGENIALSGDLTTHVADLANPHVVSLEHVGGISSGDFVTHTGLSNNPHTVTLEHVGGISSGDFTTHTGNTSNPHVVSLEDVGGISSGDFVTHTGDLTNPHAVTTTLIGAATAADLTSHTSTSSIHFLESQIDHLNILNIGSKTHAQIDTHIADLANPHRVTTTQIGAVTVPSFSNHTGDLTNPHAVTIEQIGAISSGDFVAHTGDTSLHGAGGNTIDVSDGTTLVSTITGISYTGGIVVVDDSNSGAVIAVDHGAVLYTDGSSNMGGNKLFFDTTNWNAQETVGNQFKIQEATVPKLTFSSTNALMGLDLRMGANNIVRSASDSDRIDMGTNSQMEFFIAGNANMKLTDKDVRFASGEIHIDDSGIYLQTGVDFRISNEAGALEIWSGPGEVDPSLRILGSVISVSPKTSGIGLSELDLGSVDGHVQIRGYGHAVTKQERYIEAGLGSNTGWHYYDANNPKMRIYPSTSFDTGIIIGGDQTNSGTIILNNGTYTTTISMATGQGANVNFTLPTGAPPGDGATLKWDAGNNSLIWVAAF